MPTTVYCQAINGEVLLCMEDGRTYSRRGEMKKIRDFYKQLMLKQSCHITSLDESDPTYYEVYNIT
jgi:hypothetical protein